MGENDILSPSPYLHKKRFTAIIIFITSFLLLVTASLTEGMQKHPPGRDGREFSSAAQLMAKVMKEASSAKSLTCSVVQEKHLAMLSGPVIFKGTMSMERPDRLRWEFTEPVPSVFIINGPMAMRCTPGSKPVKFDINSSATLKQAVMQMMAWLNGDYKKLSFLFDISLSDSGTGLVMVPSDKKSDNKTCGMETLTVMFHPLLLRPEKVIIKERGGDWTEITFNNYNINCETGQVLFTECPY